MASPSHYLDIGTLGEDFVAQCLEEKGWTILHRRWRLHRGEIDIIAEYKQPSPTINSTLAFIEVKTRTVGNWDSGGRDAVSKRKQQKIWHTAQLFLAQHPDKANCNCRFDVAIVLCKQEAKHSSNPSLNLNQDLSNQSSQETLNYYLTIQEYIVSAFDSLSDDC
ncbi:MAG: YraN family protein [Calothrix sp. C42_A2020_038]|nr:YraN family protein [Calothrix sp. C42_A2020_038]